jgi:hypothetical protein
MAGAIIIGQETGYGTWCGLRDVFAWVEVYDYSREYLLPPQPRGPAVALKSAADGSGLIRADFDKTYVQMTTGVFGINATNVRLTPPPAIADYVMSLNWWDSVSSPQSTFVPVEIQTQLTGETVTLTNGLTFTITSDLFTNTDGEQQFLTNVLLSSMTGVHVVSVGKLTPLT